MKRTPTALAAVLLVLLTAWMSPALAGPILINGSFEIGPPMGGSHDVNIPQGSTAIVGWLVTRVDIELLGPPWDVSDGVHAVDLDGCHPGGIEHTFATIAGEICKVSFGMSGNPMGSPQVKRLRVTAAARSRTMPLTRQDRATAASTGRRTCSASPLLGRGRL